MTIKQAQARLMAAGFPLPRFGADGGWGGETHSAFSRALDELEALRLRVAPAAPADAPGRVLDVFFSRVRATLFDGSLTQDAVDGMNAIIRAFDTYGDGNPRHLAYCLATAHHETGRFRWLREIWGPTAQQRKYEPPQALAKRLGNTQAGDGKRYFGRGYVHITGRANYADWSQRLGMDLVGNPELAAEREVAARILVEGVMRGTFTGKKLGDYQSFADMRRTVNGTDKAALIAGYAEKYLAALS